MAIERVKRFLTLNLAEVIQTRTDSFSGIRKDIQLSLEAVFAQRVIDEDLTYEQQLQVRKEMISAEKARVFPDTDYVRVLEKDVRAVRKLAKFQKLRDDYTQTWREYQEGTINIDRYIEVLRNRLTTTNDPDLRADLNASLNQAVLDKRAGEEALLNNRVALAKEDGSEELLLDVISELKIARAKEAVAGNEERVAALDTQIASLDKGLGQVRLETSINDIEFDALKGGLNPVQRLNSLNAAVTSADSISAVNIGGVRFNSARQYWEFVRGAYLNGEGSGIFGDFFAQLNQNFADEIAASAATNEFGFVPNGVIQAIADTYAELEANPVLANNIQRLRTARNSALNAAVTKSADAILQNAKGTLDWTGVDNALLTLQQNFGIDTAQWRAQAAIDAVQVPGQRISAIRRTAQEELIAEGVDPTSDEFDALVVERENLLSQAPEAQVTLAEKTPTERAEEKVTPPPTEVKPTVPPEEVEPVVKPVVEPEAPPTPPIQLSATSTLQDVESFLEQNPGAPIKFAGLPEQFIRTPGNVLRGLRDEQELQKATQEGTVKTSFVEIPAELKELFEVSTPFFT